MENKEFKKLFSQIAEEMGFNEISKKLYVMSKNDLNAYIDLQKSVYDADSYYFNFGFTVDCRPADTETGADYLVSGRLEVGGKILFEPRNLTNAEAVRKEIISQLNSTVKIAIDYDLSEFFNKNPEYKVQVYPKVENYLERLKMIR
jgi:hypothetical protein